MKICCFWIILLMRLRVCIFFRIIHFDFICINFRVLVKVNSTSMNLMIDTMYWKMSFDRIMYSVFCWNNQTICWIFDLFNLKWINVILTLRINRKYWFQSARLFYDIIKWFFEHHSFSKKLKHKSILSCKIQSVHFFFTFCLWND